MNTTKFTIEVTADHFDNPLGMYNCLVAILNVPAIKNVELKNMETNFSGVFGSAYEDWLRLHNLNIV